MEASANSPDQGRRTISGREQRELLARAHRLKAHLVVGRSGLNPGLVRQVDENLEANELLKVRIEAQNRQEVAQVAAELARLVQAELLQRIGHVAVLYRRAGGETGD